MNESRVDTDAVQEIIRRTRTWVPEVEPTAEEWVRWFRRLDPDSAQMVAGYMLERQREDAQCFLLNHVEMIRALELEVAGLRKAMRDQRADRFQQAWRERNDRDTDDVAVRTWLSWFTQLTDEEVDREVLRIVRGEITGLVEKLRALVGQLTVSTAALGQDRILLSAVAATRSQECPMHGSHPHSTATERRRRCLDCAVCVNDQPMDHDALQR